MSKSVVAEKVVNYIEEHLDEEISLDKIAEDLNYSKFYLARIFMKETGKSIYKYVQGRRLTLAAWKLAETGKPIVEIAYEAQYQSQQAFTAAFRQLYFCTPQVFRNHGVFYPRQPRINMKGLRGVGSHISCRMGGRIAA